MAERLRAGATAGGLAVQVAGPAPAYVARRAERWRYNVVLRGADPVALLDPPPARRGRWTSTRRACCDAVDSRSQPESRVHELTRRRQWADTPMPRLPPRPTTRSSR